MSHRFDPDNKIDVFSRHLQAIFAEEDLYSAVGKSQSNFDLQSLVEEINAQYVDVHKFIEVTNIECVLQKLESFAEAGRSGGRRLVVAPCSPLFEDVLEQLDLHCENVQFVDMSRGGCYIGKSAILNSRDFTPESGDLCLIMTRNTQAIAAYRELFGEGNYIDLLEEYDRSRLRSVSPNLSSFIDKLNAAEKPILFSSPRPMGTLSSTVRELGQRGYQTFWIGSDEIKEERQLGYSTPRAKDVAFTDYFVGSFLDMLTAFCEMEHGTVLYHFEAIYAPNWDFNRVAVCYAATLAFIRAVKECRLPDSSAKVALYMYDAIKPGIKHYERGSSCGRLYKAMMREAEAIVFSSYMEPFGDFVENAVGKPLPRVHCHRYQVMPKHRRPRLADAYHIAIISVLLEEFWEPSRMGLLEYIRDIIGQGIHIHYYASDPSHPKIREFKESLPVDRQHQLQVHKPIHDLDELASELSQYHAGWSLFNMQIFNDMTTYLTDQFTSDAMELFTPTTLPSVIWTAAAAGLPVICNRSMRGVVDMLPEGMSIPLQLSELGNLKNILDSLDWEKIDSTSLDGLDIANQIYKLSDFLEQIHAG